MSVLKSREGMETVAAELARLSPEVTAAIATLRQAAYAPGRVPSRFKLLAAAAISVSIRCEPCIRAYVEWAAKKGATKEELVEFLDVAMTMQGCPGEEWALKALRAWDELVEGKGSAAGGSAAPTGAAGAAREGAAGEDEGCCAV